MLICIFFHPPYILTQEYVLNVIIKMFFFFVIVVLTPGEFLFALYLEMNVDSVFLWASMLKMAMGFVTCFLTDGEAGIIPSLCHV